MTFISKNNRVPLVLLILLVVGYLLYWAYLLREGVIVQQWTYWRLGLLAVVVFLFIISQVARNETFSIWIVLGTIFVSWVAGLLWWAGFLFIMWRVPGYSDINFTYVLLGQLTAVILGCFFAEL